MKKLYFTLIMIISFAFNFVYSQNVGINTTGAAPDAGAGLDVNFTNKGMLIPRVNIANLATIAPITGSTTTSMLVYNTNATTGVGYYYWNGSAWVRFATSGDAWEITGNAGTNPTNNFLGTTDNQALVFRTNNTERMRVLAGGQVAVNSTTTFATSTFFSTATGNNNAIDGNAAGTGSAVYGQNTGTGNAIYGLSNSATGLGVLALNINANGPGMIATGANGGLNYFPGTGGNFNGNTGLYAFGDDVTSTGIVGAGNNILAPITLTAGSGVAGTGLQYGVIGIGTSTTAQVFGGYFEGDGTFAYVGGWLPAWTAYKIIGNGTVSTIVNDENENPVVMFAPEAPEILFQDYGVGQLINGEAVIELDPIISKNIRVDSEHPLKVFVQLEGDCNGVYVTNKTENGFKVKELQGGNSNVSFSWSIVATRADQQITLSDGSIRTSNNSVRFPDAPVKQDLKTNGKALQLKKTNLK